MPSHHESDLFLRRAARTTAGTFLAVAAIALAVPGAHAFSALDGHQRFGLIREGRLLELQVLESRQRSLQFQELQRHHRQEDRDTLRYRSPKVEVPRMQRNCQLQPYGSKFLPNCR